MQLSSLFFAVVAAVSVFAQAPDPAINTPSGAQECLPVQLTFSGTAPPFIITVVPGGQASAAPLTTVGTTSDNSITWVVNQPAGTSLTLVIRDSLGRTNPSGTFTVNPGNTSCYGSSSAAAGSTAAGSSAVASSAAPASSAVVTTSQAVVTTTTAVASGASSATVTTKATSATVISSAAASSTKNAAPAVQPLGVAGLVGLAGVAALL